MMPLPPNHRPASKSPQTAIAFKRLSSMYLLAFCLIVCAGCQQDIVETTYGKRGGTPGRNSVNGTVVLADLFDRAGFTVRTWRRLSPRLNDANVIVWAPDDFLPPGPTEREFLTKWLKSGTNKTLIYVGRDFDAGVQYWKSVQKSNQSAEQTEELLRRLGQVTAQREAERLKMPKLWVTPWGTFQRDAPTIQPNTLTGEWAESLNADDLDIVIRGRLRDTTAADITALKKKIAANAVPTVPLATPGGGTNGSDAVTSGDDDVDSSDADSDDPDSNDAGGGNADSDGASDAGDNDQGESDEDEVDEDEADDGSGNSTNNNANQNAAAGIFGVFLPRGLESAFKASDIPDSESLLSIDGVPMVRRLTSDDWQSGQVLMVTNGSAILNLPLVNHEHRKFAGLLINECQSSGRVYFVESGRNGIRVLDVEPAERPPSGWELFVMWPANVMWWHLSLMGIVFCFCVVPIFGRAHGWKKENVSDFGKHIQALGRLLRGTGDRGYASDRLREYQEQRKN